MQWKTGIDAWSSSKSIRAQSILEFLGAVKVKLDLWKIGRGTMYYAYTYIYARNLVRIEFRPGCHTTNQPIIDHWVMSVIILIAMHTAAQGYRFVAMNTSSILTFDVTAFRVELQCHMCNRTIKRWHWSILFWCWNFIDDLWTLLNCWASKCFVSIICAVPFTHRVNCLDLESVAFIFHSTFDPYLHGLWCNLLGLRYQIHWS